uniref:Uncharacterized protein n=1 Tax=Romanomermis culicivorax TaxID=13658 RepID=A0A915L2B1_ROMCU
MHRRIVPKANKRDRCTRRVFTKSIIDTVFAVHHRN